MSEEDLKRIASLGEVIAMLARMRADMIEDGKLPDFPESEPMTAQEKADRHARVVKEYNEAPLRK
jgi:hypothetical protein